MKAYRTKGGNRQLLDIYTDDLSIYLKYDCNNKRANNNNVLEVLTTIELFYKWSGLKVNRGKEQITIFGEKFQKPNFVEKGKIKWCSMFRLLGIQFCNTLSNMEFNYIQRI